MKSPRFTISLWKIIIEAHFLLRRFRYLQISIKNMKGLIPLSKKIMSQPLNFTVIIPKLIGLQVLKIFPMKQSVDQVINLNLLLFHLNWEEISVTLEANNNQLQTTKNNTNKHHQIHSPIQVHLNSHFLDQLLQLSSKLQITPLHQQVPLRVVPHPLLIFLFLAQIKQLLVSLTLAQ